jgi:hypothetical protein
MASNEDESTSAEDKSDIMANLQIDKVSYWPIYKFLASPTQIPSIFLFYALVTIRSIASNLSTYANLT